MFQKNDILRDALACFRKARRTDTHKGDYGRVLVIAGSQGMTGAASLCAKAALHMGAGLVYMAAPEGLMPIYETLNPECVKCAVGEAADKRFYERHFTELLALSQDQDAVVLGPGLGSDPDTYRLVRALVAEPDFASKALIVDADGLNAFRRYQPELETAMARRTGKMFFIPHEGEFARLTGLSVAEIHGAREAHATAWAQQMHGATVILKGAGTVCTDGSRTYINTTGNPGMATGGSGDVLAGMLAGLAATEQAALSAFQVGAYGVALHGYCGDLAAAKYGERFMTAGCMIEEMGALCHDAG